MELNGVDTAHLVPGEATSLDVLAEADEALYEAKRAGRDRVAVRDLDFD